MTGARLLSLTRHKSDNYANQALSLIRIKVSTSNFKELALAGPQAEKVPDEIALWVPEAILAVAMRDTAKADTPLTVTVSVHPYDGN